MLAFFAAPAAADEAIGLKAPEGFDVSLFADDKLAHDIFSLTFDSFGRAVVSGPGYVRILLDTDRDGTADAYQEIVDGPETGAQGMYFHGRDLICTGDAGLIRYRDSDGDDRADGPPDVFLRIKAGGEHHAHSIQKGPDGWWYLVAGNYAEVGESYASLPTSPIREPRSGVVMRLKPDLSGGELVADGFRNVYDFAFTATSDLFVYDSDGERDVSLPWYRPTRVFHVLAGANAGWVSRSWKRPAYFFNSPPVVASLGRGSPTGVCCYRHRRFPAKYHGALFVLDWTFGRVTALPLEPGGSTWKTEPIEFLHGVGRFGFAPTDAAVGPEGDLFVSVGGRGTRGGVYRIRHIDNETAHAPNAASEKERTPLERCLNAPQPLTSWSRAEWIPLANKLGSDPFVNTALDEQAPEAQRLRAIEILTEVFAGLDTDSLRSLAGSASAAVRARAAWSAGRQAAIVRRFESLSPFIDDEHPAVARVALESLIGPDCSEAFDELLPALTKQLQSDDRFVRQAAANVGGRLPAMHFQELLMWSRLRGHRALVSLLSGRLEREPLVDLEALSAGLEALRQADQPALRLDAVRLMQLALGDAGPSGELPPVFDGYSSRADLRLHERDLDPFRAQLAALYPTGERKLDFELGRLLAMLTPYNSKLLDKVLDRIAPDSHPVDDLHHLIIAARIAVDRTAVQREKIASTLVRLERRIADLGLNQDRHWNVRVGELYDTLVEHDPLLPRELLKHPGFGQPGHVLFMTQVDRQQWQQAIDRFVELIENDREYRWTHDVVFLLGESSAPEHREMVRRQFDNFVVRNAVLLVLSERPQNEDREKFLQGLESSPPEILGACLSALDKLPPSEKAADQLVLVRALRRLRGDKRERELRDKVVELLRRNTGQQFGYQLGRTDETARQSEPIEKWTAWVRDAYPQEAARQASRNRGDLEQLQALLADVDWTTGDASRGRMLFEKRSCAQCHSSSSALGPDLAGAAARFSREDLFTAIADPSRDVSPRYHTTLIETAQGKVYSGLVVYEAVDGIMLRNATNQTFRIPPDDVESRHMLSTSLMPTGLLNDLQPRDLADLYAYLSSLNEDPQQTDLSRAD